MQNQNILIVAESRDGAVLPVAFELLSKARSLFGQTATVAFALAGKGLDGAVRELEGSGADRVYCLDDGRLAQFHPDYHAAAICAAAREYDPDVLLVGATATGEELAPTLGSRLETGVAAHCVDLKLVDGVFMQMVPAFGGKVIGEIYTPRHRPQIASIKPGIFRAEPQAARPCETVRLSAGVLDAVRTRIKVVGSRRAEFDGIPVEQAEVVVCGGYGVGSAEHWKELEALANKLGAAVGYTRPVVDNGWVDGEEGMIGTSGKSVRPKVYLGFGISGATHHLCGIKDAGTIIAVNRDADAEVFAASDCKAVADAPGVVHALCELLP